MKIQKHAEVSSHVHDARGLLPARHARAGSFTAAVVRGWQRARQPGADAVGGMADARQHREHRRAPTRPPTVYVGYFDPDKCYKYQYDATRSVALFLSGRHGGRGPRLQLHAQEWSGNFLNWATTQTIDPFRKATHRRLSHHRHGDASPPRKGARRQPGRRQHFPGSAISPTRRCRERHAGDFRVGPDQYARARSRQPDALLARRRISGTLPIDVRPRSPHARPIPLPDNNRRHRSFEVSVRVKVCDPPSAGSELRCVRHQLEARRPDPEIFQPHALQRVRLSQRFGQRAQWRRRCAPRRSSSARRSSIKLTHRLGDQPEHANGMRPPASFGDQSATPTATRPTRRRTDAGHHQQRCHQLLNRFGQMTTQESQEQRPGQRAVLRGASATCATRPQRRRRTTTSSGTAATAYELGRRLPGDHRTGCASDPIEYCCQNRRSSASATSTPRTRTCRVSTRQHRYNGTTRDATR